MRSKKLTAGVALAACAVFALVLATWATGASQAPAQTIGSGKATAKKSVCGLGTGKKATGRPIKLGAINMLIPGVDFTTISKVAAAYFKCVNDNGGIKGRPITYIQYTEQLNPAQEAALARKLIQSDKVVGVVGNTSFAECGVNWKYYKSKGFTVIGAGRPGRVLRHSLDRRVEHGPALPQHRCRAGSDPRGRQEDRRRVAGHDLGVRGRWRGQARQGDAGSTVKLFPTHLPVTDASSQLLQMYQFAGDGNGILLDFTPDTAPAFMTAAISMGIVSKIKWGSSTPIANTFMAGQFPQFDGHLWINSEFGLLDASQGPDTRLMIAILKKYSPSIAPQAFAQMGFMDAKFATAALLNVKGPVTAASYNRAVRGLKNIKTDMLCKPWYVGNLPFHIPNNTDITVDYKDGKVVKKESCFDIAAVDKELAQTRVWEKKLKLNTG